MAHSSVFSGVDWEVLMLLATANKNLLGRMLLIQRGFGWWRETLRGACLEVQWQTRVQPTTGPAEQAAGCSLLLREGGYSLDLYRSTNYE